MADEPKPPPMRVVHKGWNTREEEAETAEVVERLRNGCPRRPGCGQATLDEAAAEITRLREEARDFRHAAGVANIAADALRARVAELEAALLRCAAHPEIRAVLYDDVLALAESIRRRALGDTHA